MQSNIVRFGLIRYFWQFWHVSEKYIMRSCTVFFGDLQMCLAVIFSFRNETYGLNSVIYGNVRSYTVGVGYVHSYTIIPRTNLATNRLFISLSVLAGMHSLIRRDMFAK